MMKLLIVDDHAGVRAMIRQLAALPAEAVRECACGEEAIRVAREFAPDVVTMDIRLPGLGGFAVTRVIRAVHPATRVVMVSSYDQPELRQAAHLAGAASYVVKDNLGQLRPILAPHEAASQPAPNEPDRKN